MPIQRLLLCATGESDSAYPSGLCRAYMMAFRVTEQDVRDLERGAGLEFILNLSSQDKYNIADAFIAEGLDIDGVNHFSGKALTPLQAAVLYGDLRRVHYLIHNGAQVDLENIEGMTALDLARKAHKNNPQDQVMLEILNLLSQASSEPV